MGDDHSEVFNSGFLKLTFICSEIQLVLLQDLQDSSGDFSMFVDSFHEDEDVVQVDHNYTFCNELFKDVVHHCLEGSQAVCETEEHNEWFEQSAVCSEGSLPFVTFLDADIVEAPPNIQLHEVLGSAELCYQFRNKWERIFVLHGHGIQCAIILHQSEFTILLLNEEDWRGHGGLGRSDPTRVEVLLEEGIQFLLFQGSERVDLTAFWSSLWKEFNCMVPRLGPRQFVKGVL